MWTSDRLARGVYVVGALLGLSLLVRCSPVSSCIRNSDCQLGYVCAVPKCVVDTSGDDGGSDASDDGMTVTVDAPTVEASGSADAPAETSTDAAQTADAAADGPCTTCPEASTDAATPDGADAGTAEAGDASDDGAGE